MKTWIDRPQVEIARRRAGFTAQLRNGEAFRYDAFAVTRPDSGDDESVCPTIDHIIAAAGW